MKMRNLKKISIFTVLFYVIGGLSFLSTDVRAASSDLVANPYPVIQQQNLEYKDGKVISPILPYGDYFSSFTKLPLAHTKSTGKGINIGVIGDSQYANFIYFVARDSKVYTYNKLSIDDIKSQGIKIAVITDFRKYSSDDLKTFITNCNLNNIVLVIGGDMASTDQEIKLANSLESLGAILIGRLSGLNLGTYYSQSNETKAINDRIKDISINIFAPEMVDDCFSSENTYKALYGTTGAIALLEQVNLSFSNPKEIKDYLIKNSRQTWESKSVDGKTDLSNLTKTDEITGFITPKANSAIYSYKILDFQKLLNVQITPNWNANIFDCYKAWQVSKGNVDVAVIDSGFYSDRPDIKSNIVEKKVIGDNPFGDYKQWHGSQMIAALLSIAPEAKVHAIVADTNSQNVDKNIENFTNAIEYCIGSNIKVISTSMGPWADVPKVREAIQKAVDSGITFSWFAYGENDKVSYEGVLSSSCIWDHNSGPYVLERFIDKEGTMPENLSWGRSPTAPQVAGLAALIKAANTQISPKEIASLLKDNSFKFADGQYIPNMNKALSSFKPYYYFLYNSTKVNDNDVSAIKDYTSKIENENQVVLKDVSEYTNATDIYQMLKLDSKNRSGSIKGIQIFGTSDDVPAFNIHNKIQMNETVDDSGYFNSDFFYSSFKSDVNSLKDDFSIYKAFNNKLDVNFVPDWSVVRLPLTKGEIAPYMQRSQQYVYQVASMPFGNFVDFSNPIFPEKNHSDDMGYFIKERLDKQFNILSSNDYKLYGNKQGAYPVQTDVIGDYTKDNISKENKDGIKEFIINDHGQWDNIDQCIYTTEDKSSEKRISFLNMNTINSVLSTNYYDLDLWTCLNAYNLNGNNLIHEAMSNGKCISAMAASSTISNNGVHDAVTLENMKKNNFYYYYLNYFYDRASGQSRTNSFYLAQKDYAQEILKNTDMLMDGNYQYNLHNLLSYHYLGLIEYWDSKGKSDFNPKLDDSDDNNNQNSFDGNIKFNSDNSNNGFKVNSFKAERIGDNIEFTLNYESSTDCDYSFFNPPDGDKIMKIVNGGIKKGTNTSKFSLNVDEFNKVLLVNSISMRFGFTDNSNFISFDPSQLKSLLINNYTVSFNSQGGSSVSTKNAANNSLIIAPGIPTKVGYTFGGWYKEGTCINVWNFITDNVTSDAILYAKWISKPSDVISVSYQGHVQSIGWQNWVSDGQEAGTDGKGLRVEALKIKLINAPTGANIKYQAHVQCIGWQNWIGNGQEAGTDGKSLRVEALKISLENMPGYSIQYQAHVQSLGWQDWVSDGQEAGTDGKSLRIEAIRIRIVKN